MTEKEPDIVTDILQRAMDVVRAELGPAGLDDATLETVIARIGALETPVRRDYARADVYIAARGSDFEAKKAAALAEVQRTGRVAEASSKHGISRRTLYNLLASRRG
ncbi:MAG: hypothetical protein RLZZ373_1108 [Pseudomonadota bacterium]|jgi:transcriptional regulator of acetoin/glycerol metabolism